MAESSEILLPQGSFFNLGNRKKYDGDRWGKYGGCGTIRKPNSAAAATATWAVWAGAFCHGANTHIFSIFCGISWQFHCADRLFGWHNVPWWWFDSFQVVNENYSLAIPEHRCHHLVRERNNPQLSRKRWRWVFLLETLALELRIEVVDLYISSWVTILCKKTSGSFRHLQIE